MKYAIIFPASFLAIFALSLISAPAFAWTSSHGLNQKTNRMQVYLNKEVHAGKITAQQEQLILPELQTLWKNKPNLRSMTKAQTKTFFQTQRQAFLTWAKQNGINSSLVFGSNPLHSLHPFYRHVR